MTSSWWPRPVTVDVFVWIRKRYILPMYQLIRAFLQDKTNAQTKAPILAKVHR